MAEPDDTLLRFIASTVEHLRDRMATKDDLVDLRDRMTTKEDLVDLLGRMATKDDLVDLRDRMTTKEDLVDLRDRMATKEDLVELRADFRAELRGTASRLESRMDAGFTAVRGDIERVWLRLDTVGHGLHTRLSRLETDVSRIRSVTYLLVKDQPDLLRLLGTEP